MNVDSKKPKLTFATGNYGKYASVKEKCESMNIDVNFFEFDAKEPDINDISVISKEKAKEAYEKIQSPVLVNDSGFYIEDYPNMPGYPGAFVKRSGISSNIEQLLDTMKNVENRSCYFLECMTYYDGIEFKQFYGKSEGILTTSIKGKSVNKAWSSLWNVFIPKNYTLTLAEMSDEERTNRKDGHTSSITEFLNWYVNDNK